MEEDSLPSSAARANISARSQRRIGKELRPWPSSSSVVQSTKFEFVINLKTAKALGIEAPISMQLLADEVIE
jgi:hypothetical protein